MGRVFEGARDLYCNLIKLDIEELEFGLCLLKDETDSLKKRIEMVFGAFDKFGLITGVLSTVVAVIISGKNEVFTYFYIYVFLYTVIFIAYAAFYFRW